MANWRLPIGEAKEILAKIARKTKQDREALGWHYQRLPEPVQDFWINSFGDIAKPGLAKERARSAIADEILGMPEYPDYKAALSRADKVLVDHPYIMDNYNDVIFKHPEIEVRKPHELANAGGYVRPGISQQLVVRSDVGPKTVLHEGTHYGDKARGALKSFNEGDVFAYPVFESSDWLPRTAQESPILSADVERLLDKQNRYAYAHMLDVSQPLSPLLAMSRVDLTKPANVDVFNKNNYLWQDRHGLDYFKDVFNPNEISGKQVATEGLAQWLEELPTMKDLENLDLSKRIIERLEDDPRRNFKIDFNKFMEEPDVLPPW